MENKVLYAKYNRERLPQYQVATILYESETGKYIKKKPLQEPAKQHILDIHQNSKQLSEVYNGIDVLNGDIVNDSLIYPFLKKQQSWDSILLEAIQDKNKIQFYEHLQSYILFLEKLQDHPKQSFQAEGEFQKVFGPGLTLEEATIIQPANIDLIFDNIFIDEKGNYTLIDCEWVFPFAVPTSFILYRSIYAFYLKHKLQLASFLSLDEILQKCGINKKLAEVFNEMEEKYFQYYVCGEVHKNDIISKYVKENVGIEYLTQHLEGQQYNLKLYAPTEEGYSEDHCYSFVLNAAHHQTELDIRVQVPSAVENYTWRLDPTGVPAFFDLKRITFSKTTSKATKHEFIEEVDIHAMRHNEDVILYETEKKFAFIAVGEDPQLFFDFQPDPELEEVILTLTYSIDLNISSYVDYYRKSLHKKSLELIDFHAAKVEAIEQQVEQQKLEIEALHERNESLNHELLQEQMRNANLTQLLSSVTSSRSWRITTPLRSIGQFLKKNNRK